MYESRTFSSVMIATVIGTAVMIFVNQLGHGGDLLSPGEYLASKGVLYGCFVALVTFAVARVLFTLRSARSWALLVVAIITGLFGLLVLNWNLMWGFSPFSLEGAWLWPLAVVPLALSLISLRRWRHHRKTRLST